LSTNSTADKLAKKRKLNWLEQSQKKNDLYNRAKVVTASGIASIFDVYSTNKLDIYDLIKPKRHYDDLLICYAMSV